MNTMIPISHRLFASALAGNAASRRRNSPARKPVIIEVGRKGVAPVWVNGLPRPTQRSASGDYWVDGSFQSE